jgi:predicted ATP-grasp superfamily ATP-dependent carboligase
MKILVFEWLMGGGVSDQYPLDEATLEFLEQGRMMLSRVCEDFLEQGHQLVVPVDRQQTFELPETYQRVDVKHPSRVPVRLRAVVDQVDAILLIAPETDGCLENVCAWLAPWKEKFISPDVTFVRLAADKWNCQHLLTQAGINCPKSILFDDGVPVDEQIFNSLKGPLVIKPIDGAGSEGVSIVEKQNDIHPLIQAGKFIVQEFVEGIAVSVSAVVSLENAPLFLQPMEQVFKRHPIGPFSHSTPIADPNVVERAKTLAVKTFAKLPPTHGYVSLDMVISSRSAAADCVIEINPRLTTSYAFQESSIRLQAARTMANLVACTDLT